MRASDVIQLSTRMFKTRKMRTSLTILGIGIGIGAIVFLVSLGYGLQKALIEQITSSDALLSLDVVQGETTGLVFNIEDEKSIIGKEVSVSFLAVKTGESGQEDLDLIEQTGMFKIAGVVGDESSSFIFFPISKVAGLTIDSYSQMKVRVNSTNDLDAVRDKILDMGFAVAALSDVVDQANKIFRILQ